MQNGNNQLYIDYKKILHYQPRPSVGDTVFIISVG